MAQVQLGLTLDLEAFLGQIEQAEKWLGGLKSQATSGVTLRAYLDTSSLQDQLKAAQKALSQGGTTIKVATDFYKTGSQYAISATRLKTQVINPIQQKIAGNPKYTIKIGTELAFDQSSIKQIEQVIAKAKASLDAPQPGVTARQPDVAGLRKQLTNLTKPPAERGLNAAGLQELKTAAKKAGIEISGTTAAELRKEMPSAFAKVADESILGLSRGLASGESKLTAAGSDAGKALLKSLKKFLGIASPAKKLAKEVGEPSIDGVGKGWVDRMPKVERQMVASLRATMGNVWKQGLARDAAARGAFADFGRDAAQLISTSLGKHLQKGVASSVIPALKGALVGGAGGMVTGGLVGGLGAAGAAVRQAAGPAMTAFGSSAIPQKLGMLGHGAASLAGGGSSDAITTFLQNSLESVVQAALGSGGQSALLGAAGVAGVAGMTGFAKGAGGSLVNQAVETIKNWIQQSAASKATKETQVLRQSSGALQAQTAGAGSLLAAEPPKTYSASLSKPQLNLLKQATQLDNTGAGTFGEAWKKLGGTLSTKMELSAGQLKALASEIETNPVLDDIGANAEELGNGAIRVAANIKKKFAALSRELQSDQLAANQGSLFGQQGKAAEVAANIGRNMAGQALQQAQSQARLPESTGGAVSAPIENAGIVMGVLQNATGSVAKALLAFAKELAPGAVKQRILSIVWSIDQAAQQFDNVKRETQILSGKIRTGWDAMAGGKVSPNSLPPQPVPGTGLLRQQSLQLGSVVGRTAFDFPQLGYGSKDGKTGPADLNQGRGYIEQTRNSLQSIAGKPNEWKVVEEVNGIWQRIKSDSLLARERLRSIAKNLTSDSSYDTGRLSEGSREKGRVRSRMRIFTDREGVGTFNPFDQAFYRPTRSPERPLPWEGPKRGTYGGTFSGVVSDGKKDEGIGGKGNSVSKWRRATQEPPGALALRNVPVEFFTSFRDAERLLAVVEQRLAAVGKAFETLKVKSQLQVDQEVRKLAVSLRAVQLALGKGEVSATDLKAATYGAAREMAGLGAKTAQVQNLAQAFENLGVQSTEAYRAIQSQRNIDLKYILNELPKIPGDTDRRSERNRARNLAVNARDAQALQAANDAIRSAQSNSGFGGFRGREIGNDELGKAQQRSSLSVDIDQLYERRGAVGLTSQNAETQRRVLKAYTKEIDNAERALRVLNGEAKDGETITHLARNAWGTILDDFKNLVPQLLVFAVAYNLIIQRVLSTPGAIIQAAASFDRLETSISAYLSATRGIGDSSSVIGELQGVALSLGIGFEKAASSYLRFAAATQGTPLEGQEVDITRTIATAGRNQGLNGEQIDRASVALTQILSKGRVQSEELRGQLAEQLPGALQVAARAFGVTTKELYRMVEAGQIAGDEFVGRFMRQLKAEGASTNQLAGSFSNVSEQLGSSIQSLAASAGRPFLEPLTLALQALNAAITAIVPLGGLLAAGFITVGAAAAKGWLGIKSWRGAAADLIGISKQVETKSTGILDTRGNPLNRTTTRDRNPIGSGVLAKFEKDGRSAGASISKRADFVKTAAWDGFTTTIDKSRNAISGLKKGLTDLPQMPIGRLATFSNTLSAGIQSSAKSAVDLGAGLRGAMMSGQALAGGLSKSFRADLGNAFQTAAETAGGAFKKISGSARQQGRVIRDAFTSAAAFGGEELANATSLIGTKAKPVVASSRNALRDAAAFGGEELANVTSLVGTKAKPVVASSRKALRGVRDFVVEEGKDISGLIKEDLSGALSFINNQASTVGKGLVAAIAPIQSNLQRLSSTLISVGDRLRSAGAMAKVSFVGGIAAAKDYGQVLSGNVLTGIKSIAGQAQSIKNSVAGRLSSLTRDASSSAIRAGKDFLGNAASSALDVGSRVKAGAMQSGRAIGPALSSAAGASRVALLEKTGAASAASKLRNNLQPILGATSDIAAQVSEQLMGSFTNFASKVNGPLAAIRDQAKSTLGGIGGMVQSGLGNLGPSLRDRLAPAIESVKGVALQAREVVSQTKAGLQSLVVGGSDAVNQIVGRGGDVAARVKRGVQDTLGYLGNVSASAGQALGSAASAAGVIPESTKSAISGLLESVGQTGSKIQDSLGGAFKTLDGGVRKIGAGLGRATAIAAGLGVNLLSAVGPMLKIYLLIEGISAVIGFAKGEVGALGDELKKVNKIAEGGKGEGLNSLQKLFGRLNVAQNISDAVTTLDASKIGDASDALGRKIVSNQKKIQGAITTTRQIDKALYEERLKRDKAEQNEDSKGVEKSVANIKTLEKYRDQVDFGVSPEDAQIQIEVNKAAEQAMEAVIKRNESVDKNNSVEQKSLDIQRRKSKAFEDTAKAEGLLDQKIMRINSLGAIQSRAKKMQEGLLTPDINSERYRDQQLEVAGAQRYATDRQLLPQERALKIQEMTLRKISNELKVQENIQRVKLSIIDNERKQIEASLSLEQTRGRLREAVAQRRVDIAGALNAPEERLAAEAQLQRVRESNQTKDLQMQSQLLNKDRERVGIETNLQKEQIKLQSQQLRIDLASLQIEKITLEYALKSNGIKAEQKKEYQDQLQILNQVIGSTNTLIGQQGSLVQSVEAGGAAQLSMLDLKQEELNVQLKILKATGLTDQQGRQIVVAQQDIANKQQSALNVLENIKVVYDGLQESIQGQLEGVRALVQAEQERARLAEQAAANEMAVVDRLLELQQGRNDGGFFERMAKASALGASGEQDAFNLAQRRMELQRQIQQQQIRQKQLEMNLKRDEIKAEEALNAIKLRGLRIENEKAKTEVRGALESERLKLVMLGKEATPEQQQQLSSITKTLTALRGYTPEVPGGGNSQNVAIDSAIDRGRQVLQRDEDLNNQERRDTVLSADRANSLGRANDAQEKELRLQEQLFKLDAAQWFGQFLDKATQLGRTLGVVTTGLSEFRSSVSQAFGEAIVNGASASEAIADAGKALAGKVVTGLFDEMVFKPMEANLFNNLKNLMPDLFKTEQQSLTQSTELNTTATEALTDASRGLKVSIDGLRQTFPKLDNSVPKPTTDTPVYRAPEDVSLAGSVASLPGAASPAGAVVGGIANMLPGTKGGPNFNDGLGAGRGHGGQDLGVDVGDPVHARRSGVVSQYIPSFTRPGARYMGQGLRVKYDDGMEGTYGHMEKTDLRPGDKITAGQFLGKIFPDGDNTHLHYELRNRFMELLEPLKWVKESLTVAATRIQQAATGAPVAPALPPATPVGPAVMSPLTGTPASISNPTPVTIVPSSSSPAPLQQAGTAVSGQPPVVGAETTQALQQLGGNASQAGQSLTDVTAQSGQAAAGLGKLNEGASSATNAMSGVSNGIAGTPAAFSRLNSTISGVVGVLGSIGVGVAGAQQLGQGGISGTLTGLAGIFGAVSSISGMFGTGGIFAGGGAAAKPAAGMSAGGFAANGMGVAGPNWGFPQAPARATGGPVVARKPYIVGETGFELFIPESNGKIVSNTRSRALLDARNAVSGAMGQSEPSDPFAANRGALSYSTGLSKERHTERVMASTMSDSPKPLDIRYQSEIINQTEYVSAQQFQRGMTEAAERGRALTFNALKNSVRSRRQVGL